MTIMDFCVAMKLKRKVKLCPILSIASDSVIFVEFYQFCPLLRSLDSVIFVEFSILSNFQFREFSILSNFHFARFEFLRIFNFVQFSFCPIPYFANFHFCPIFNLYNFPFPILPFNSDSIIFVEFSHFAIVRDRPIFNFCLFFQFPDFPFYPISSRAADWNFQSL